MPECAPDYTLRADLEKKEAEKPGFLHEQLKAIDPEEAQKLHPNSTRYLIRALEIFYLTGKTKIVRFLQKISTYTLDIYLVHNLRSYYTIFASGMIFLEKYYESKKLILIIFALTGFVFICSVIVSVVKRYTLDRIFYKILHKIDDKFKLNLFE